MSSDNQVSAKKLEKVRETFWNRLKKDFPDIYSDPCDRDSLVQLILVDTVQHDRMTYMPVRRLDGMEKMSADEIQDIRETLMYNLEVAYKHLDLFHRLERLLKSEKKRKAE